jgi:hypothetical protein
VEKFSLEDDAETLLVTNSGDVELPLKAFLKDSRLAERPLLARVYDPRLDFVWHTVENPVQQVAGLIVPTKEVAKYHEEILGLYFHTAHPPSREWTGPRNTFEELLLLLMKGVIK